MQINVNPSPVMKLEEVPSFWMLCCIEEFTSSIKSKRNQIQCEGETERRMFSWTTFNNFKRIIIYCICPVSYTFKRLSYRLTNLTLKKKNHVWSIIYSHFIDRKASYQWIKNICLRSSSHAMTMTRVLSNLLVSLSHGGLSLVSGKTRQEIT